eukprot:241410-Pelagomonas_calceolata.AAC.1
MQVKFTLGEIFPSGAAAVAVVVFWFCMSDSGGIRSFSEVAEHQAANDCCLRNAPGESPGSACPW